MRLTSLSHRLVAHWVAIALALVLVPVAHPLVAAAVAPPIVSDTFTRTVSGGWGSAETGGAYTLEGGSGVFSTDGSVGSVNLPKAGATRGALLTSATARDLDTRFRVRATAPTGGQLFVYAVARRNGNNEYRPKLILNPNGTVSVHAGLVVSGAESPVGPQVVVSGLTQIPGTFLWLRARITGASPTTIQVKAWADGSAEPAAWQFTGTNSAAALQVAGAVGVRTYLNTTVTNAPATLSFDDFTVDSLDPPSPPVASFTATQVDGTLTENFTDTSTGTPTSWLWDFGDGATDTTQNPSHTYAVDGTYTVGLTATNDGGSNSVSQQVTVNPVPPPPPVPETVAADSFSRATAGTWTVADVGGIYSYQGKLSDYSTDGARGQLLLPSANQSRSAFLFSVSARDVDMTYTVSADKVAAGASYYVYGTLRRTSDGSAYRPKLRFAPGGAIYAHAGKVLPSGESSLGPEVRVPGLTYASGTVIHVHAIATGVSPTTISLRAWADGTTEPTTWQFTATDSTPVLQSAGAVGLIAYLQPNSTIGPLTVSMDDLLVTTTDQAHRVTGEVLVSAGDIAGCSTTADDSSANLLDLIAGTVQTLGDNVYPNGTASEFANCYTPTWGRQMGRTHPAVGNHEYNLVTDAGPYFDYFGAAAGERAKGWYAYDLGGWRIYVLNANCDKVGCTVGSEQEQWLRTDMAANPRTCSLAIWHQPRFSSGSEHGSSVNTQPLWQAMYDAGAEIVLSGHDHDYERFAPMNAAGDPDAANGIREFVVGTGGAGLRTLALNALPTTEVRQATNYGVLKLTLGDGEYAWEFIPIAGQTFTDRGSGTCH